jgi:hypothetical protein
MQAEIEKNELAARVSELELMLNVPDATQHLSTELLAMTAKYLEVRAMLWRLYSDVTEAVQELRPYKKLIPIESISDLVRTANRAKDYLDDES